LGMWGDVCVGQVGGSQAAGGGQPSHSRNELW
jgi:hypothetical protein